MNRVSRNVVTVLQVQLFSRSVRFSTTSGVMKKKKNGTAKSDRGFENIWPDQSGNI